jgi:hypothetical protein
MLPDLIDRHVAFGIEVVSQLIDVLIEIQVQFSDNEKVQSNCIRAFGILLSLPTLASVHQDAFVRTLTGALSSKKVKLRWNAAAAIAHAQPSVWERSAGEPVLEALLANLKSTNFKLRTLTVDALVTLPPKHALVLPTLDEALHALEAQEQTATFSQMQQLLLLRSKVRLECPQ